MLVPNRFSNLKFSLVNITALVIDYLLQEHKGTVNEILSHLKKFSSDFSRDDVIHAISLLYALGKVEYSEKNDQIVVLYSNKSKAA